MADGEADQPPPFMSDKPSDFNIFKDNLKVTLDGIYADVRTALPSMSTETDDDDDDSDVEIFESGYEALDPAKIFAAAKDPAPAMRQAWADARASVNDPPKAPENAPSSAFRAAAATNSSTPVSADSTSSNLINGASSMSESEEAIPTAKTSVNRTSTSSEAKPHIGPPGGFKDWNSYYMAPSETPISNDIARAMRPVELPPNLQPAGRRWRAWDVVDEQENRPPTSATSTKPPINVVDHYSSHRRPAQPLGARDDTDAAVSTDAAPSELSVTETELEIERQFWAAIEEAKHKQQARSESQHVDTMPELRLQTDFQAVGIDLDELLERVQNDQELIDELSQRENQLPDLLDDLHSSENGHHANGLANGNGHTSIAWEEMKEQFATERRRAAAETPASEDHEEDAPVMWAQRVDRRPLPSETAFQPQAPAPLFVKPEPPTYFQDLRAATLLDEPEPSVQPAARSGRREYTRYSSDESDSDLDDELDDWVAARAKAKGSAGVKDEIRKAPKVRSEKSKGQSKGQPQAVATNKKEVQQSRAMAAAAAAAAEESRRLEEQQQLQLRAEQHKRQCEQRERQWQEEQEAARRLEQAAQLIAPQEDELKPSPSAEELAKIEAEAAAQAVIQAEHDAEVARKAKAETQRLAEEEAKQRDAEKREAEQRRAAQKVEAEQKAKLKAERDARLAKAKADALKREAQRKAHAESTAAATPRVMESKASGDSLEWIRSTPPMPTGLERVLLGLPPALWLSVAPADVFEKARVQAASRKEQYNKPPGVDTASTRVCCFFGQAIDQPPLLAEVIDTLTSTLLAKDTPLKLVGLMQMELDEVIGPELETLGVKKVPPGRVVLAAVAAASTVNVQQELSKIRVSGSTESLGGLCSLWPTSTLQLFSWRADADVASTSESCISCAVDASVLALNGVIGTFISSVDSTGWDLGGLRLVWPTKVQCTSNGILDGVASWSTSQPAKPMLLMSLRASLPLALLTSSAAEILKQLESRGGERSGSKRSVWLAPSAAVGMKQTQQWFGELDSNHPSLNSVRLLARQVLQKTFLLVGNCPSSAYRIALKACLTFGYELMGCKTIAVQDDDLMGRLQLPSGLGAQLCADKTVNNRALVLMLHRDHGLWHMQSVLASIRCQIGDEGAVTYAPATSELVEKCTSSIWNKNTPLSPAASEADSDLMEKQYRSCGVPEVVCVILGPAILKQRISFQCISDLLSPAQLSDHGVFDQYYAQEVTDLNDTARVGMTSNADAPAALGCELIAIKYLPRLTSTQIGIAGSKLSASAINDIRSGGCLIAVLRRIDAYKTLSTYSARKRISSVLHLSPSPSNCKAVIRTIFHPDELFEDLAMQPWRPYFKPSLLSQVGPLVDTYTDGMSTVVLVDASVVQKGQLAKVLKYARKENFVLEAMRMLQPKGGSSTAPPDSHVAFLSSRSDNAPLVVLMLQRVNAVAKWLQVNGPADPSVARKLDQFSLGTLLCAEGESNPIRGSMDYDCAQFEMTHFFHEYAERWASGKSVLDGAQNNLLSEPTLTNASRQLIQLDKSAVLREVICVVISAPPASLAGENENCIAMLEGLMHQEYQLINVRQVCMSRQQAEAYCKLHLVKHGTAAAKPPNAYDLAVKLSTSPAIVLALERDNALSRMASLVSSIPTDSQQWSWSEMYCSRSPQQASAELCFFFAELFSNYYKIVGNL